MINTELARVFDRIADLIEIDGGDRFRISSFRKASRTIKDTPEDIKWLLEVDRITELPGIGKGTAKRIEQYIHSGTIDLLEELTKKFPDGITDLLEIPGLGPKKVKLLFDEKKISNIDDLKKAIDSGDVESLPGMGKQSVKKILEGIEFWETSSERTQIGIALPVAEYLKEILGKLKEVNQIEIAGSLRRGKETIGDIDILCETKDQEKVIEEFTSLKEVSRVLASGKTKASVIISVEDKDIQVDLRVVPAESFGAALLYFTGSKEHNVTLREKAINKKLRLNEYGLFKDDETPVAGKSEEEIYKKLDMKYIPPEVRESMHDSELEDRNWDDLITIEDIKSDLHMHTTASDGKNSILEMALSAKQRGYTHIAICDHSKSATIANGLSIERMEKHIEEIRQANEQIENFEILAGTECDILSDGSLDYPDDLLEQCDFVVASIHSAMSSSKTNKKSPTERTIDAIQNPFVNVIGHPTGRIINKRAPMEIDIPAIVDAAIENKTALEINANWNRLDLNDVHIRYALNKGADLSINSDAHSTGGFEVMKFGILTARRGGANAKQIINCSTLATLKKFVQAKRDLLT